MKILVTGLCTLHWGRLEYGNIGNYYIVEPTFRELHRVFPDAEILTTFQMTKEFEGRYNIRILPMDWYYGWQFDDISNAYRDFGMAEYFAQTGTLPSLSEFLRTFNECDLVLNVSGEMWGDHADPVGEGRFLVNLLRDRAVQLMGVPTVLFASSQGPFNNIATRAFAQLVYENYNVVMAREPYTIEKTMSHGFDMSNTKLYACPAFLFEPSEEKEAQSILVKEGLLCPDDTRPLVGFTICGFNFMNQPYDKWPRLDDEFIPWAELVEELVGKLKVKLVFFSHTNAFDLPPDFYLKPGRDYIILKRLYEIILKRGILKDDDITCMTGSCLPAQTKAILGKMDMVVSGRAHAAVAAISQNVPAVFISYKKELGNSKTLGFAQLAKMGDFVVASENMDDIFRVCKECWDKRSWVKTQLKADIPKVKQMAIQAFDDLVSIAEGRK